MAPIAGSSTEAASPSYDYTEGASAIDIGAAVDSNRRARRDSQYSTYYGGDGDGAMFSGPGQSANPSSVSRMSHIEIGRRSSDIWSRSRRKSIDSKGSYKRRRRGSVDSQVSRQTADAGDEQGDETNVLLDDDALSSASGRRGRRISVSPPPRSSVFENLASLFGRQAPESPPHRRPSLSHRSSSGRLSRRSTDALSENAVDTEDEEERWGYSSGEEDSDNDSIHSGDGIRDNASITPSMNYDSEPPSPIEASQTLPLLGFDSVFDGAEARIDMDTSFTLLDPPPPGPPSRQTVYISDEDNTIRFIGYETIPLRVWMWRIGCVVTFGILGLLGHWFPKWWLRSVAREKAFIDSHSGFLVVEVRISNFT